MENDVMDLISEVRLKLSVQLESRVQDMEAATCCTLFQLRASAIVTEMWSAGRAHDELVTTQPSVERGSPQIWFVTAMLRRSELALRTTNDLLPRPGEGGSGEGTPGDSRRPAAAWVKA